MAVSGCVEIFGIGAVSVGAHLAPALAGQVGDHS